jgi:hypothetical protein
VERREATRPRAFVFPFHYTPEALRGPMKDPKAEPSKKPKQSHPAYRRFLFENDKTGDYSDRKDHKND